MDAQCFSLDDTEVHFVIDCITAACAQKSTDVSMQAWLLNQQVHEVILNGANVEDAALDGLLSKELLQRLGDVANVTLGRMSEGFSAAIKSLRNNAREKDAKEADPVRTDVHRFPRTTETCGKKFDVVRPLRTHQPRRRGRNLDRSFSCEECSKVFTRKDHLMRHKLSHSGAKQFECESCHKAFSRKDKLNIHRLVHSLERPCACAECGYRYATLVSLEQHRRIHRAL